MRKFAIINESQFTEVLNREVFIQNLTLANSLNTQRKFMKDIYKIFPEKSYLDSASCKRGLGIEGINGMVRLGDFMFLGIEASKLFFYPVYMILYIAKYNKMYDGKILAEIRGYIPENGNTFDKKTRRPYNSCGTNVLCNKQELINDIAKHFYRDWDVYDKIPVIELLD